MTHLVPPAPSLPTPEPHRALDTPPGLGSSQSSSVQTARLVLGALYAAGVRDIVLAPGSRSAPFVPVLAAAEAAGMMHVRVMVDERSAAFAALGMAKAYTLRGEYRPAAVIMTSGTAVANCHPAVLEADAAGVPLIVVSADRPHELVGTGASQTTQQVGLFASAVRSQVDLPADLPVDLGEKAGAAIAGQVRRLAHAATGVDTRDPGPAHLNVRFRPPLTPLPGVSTDLLVPAWPDSDDAVAPVVGLDRGRPHTSASTARSDCRERRGDESVTCRGLIVAGDGPAPVGALARHLAEHLHWPLLAEPTSMARAGGQALTAYSPLLASPDGQALAAQCEQVVVLGHPSLTRPITALLGRDDLRIDVLADRATWTDTAGTAAAITQLPTQPMLPDQIPDFARARGYASAPHDWLEHWLEADRQLRTEQAEVPGSALTAQRAAVIAWEASVRDEVMVVVGSSMPIRYLDRAGQVPAAEPVRALANRGLAGIDGTLATATGVWHALREPVRVILGDLTFAHDLMSLSRGLCEAEPDLQIVLLDDGGGAIFSTLEYPGVLSPEVMSRYVTTPQGGDLAGAVAALGVGVTEVSSAEQLAEALALPIKGRSLLHVRLTAGRD